MIIIFICMTLVQHLAQIVPVSETLQHELLQMTTIKELAKGAQLIAPGDRCNDIYFIERGLLRGYYHNNEQKEITHWFAREGEFATSFYAFIARATSREYIEALEDCELVQIPYSSLQQLYTSFPETERIGRLLTEAYYIQLEGRLLGLQFTSARERYDALLQNNATLIQRAPLGCIASYLGITQETLSRIRGKY